jgi:putative Holliday junction resolvase
MRHIGIDFGCVRIGIAVSDAAGSIAFPRAVIANDEKAVAYITRLVEDEQAGVVVVGDARAFSGGENDVTAAADRFAAALAAALAVPVARAPEAWSSAEAARYAPHGKKHDDASAAAIILQRFLDGVE